MSAGDQGGALPPNFLLTPHQQALLFTALEANAQPSARSPANNGVSLSPSSLKGSSMRSLGSAGLEESPYLDNYGLPYDFGDSSFDDFSFASVDQVHMTGDAPALATDKSESPENESSEKRGHPDDEEGDDGPRNDSKRHEGSDKGPKKPGRKPLTSEPTTKRKAQNRAAQRAFRERKEKHLKDLETKVQELETASEAANHENSKLRVQLNRITTELNQYKQRLAVLSNVNKAPPRDKLGFGSAVLNNLSDVSFHFDMPKFGTLAGVPADTSSASLSLDGQVPSPSQSQQSQGSSARMPTAARALDDPGKFSGTPTPPVSGHRGSGSRTSVDSGNMSLRGASSSPSASSNSNGGPASSCGTSPEPSTFSPMAFKPLETLTTIGEEQQAGAAPLQPFAQFAQVDLGSPSFDWLASQNGGHFDPQLFGDYREPQDNVLSNSNFDDFFNDALEADFLTPYNVPSATAGPKKNLIDEIDAKQKSLDDTQQNMKCTEIWEKLQGCPKAQSGEFDLDGLCSELTKKAKCSGSGPVVAEGDFDTILKKFMGKDASAAKCMASSLGIKVHPDEEPNGVATL